MDCANRVGENLTLLFASAFPLAAWEHFSERQIVCGKEPTAPRRLKRDEIQSLPLILALQRNTTPRGSGHKADLGGRRGRNKKIELSNIKQIHH